MICTVCQGETRAIRRDNYSHYSVVVFTRIEIEKCQRCGTESLSPALEERVNPLVARSLIRKQGRLKAAEIWFLRRHILRKKPAELAKYLGATPVTVTRWEAGPVGGGLGPQALKGAKPSKGQDIGEASDRLLRLFVSSTIDASSAEVASLWQFFSENADALSRKSPALVLRVYWDGRRLQDEEWDGVGMEESAKRRRSSAKSHRGIGP